MEAQKFWASIQDLTYLIVKKLKIIIFNYTQKTTETSTDYMATYLKSELYELPNTLSDVLYVICILNALKKHKRISKGQCSKKQIWHPYEQALIQAWCCPPGIHSKLPHGVTQEASGPAPCLPHSTQRCCSRPGSKHGCLLWPVPPRPSPHPRSLD